MLKFKLRNSFAVLFFLICCLFVYSQDVSSDKKITSVNDKKSENSNTIKKETNVKIDPKKLKKDQIDKLKSEMKKNKEKVAESKKKIAEIDKQIEKVNEELVKSIVKDKIENTQKKKHDLVAKKLGFEQTIKEINFIYKKQEERLKSLNDNFELAEGTLNWNKTYDISDPTKFRNGKWSITVKSINENGNESKEAAINIKIDPKSDIPVLNVINPVNNARVPGNLKIVGTAMDDDGVDKILLWVDNEKQSRICEGKDFWYYDLDTSEMKDGEHTLKFKVYDIKPKPKTAESKEYLVKFQLDRKTPVIDIKTMKSGAIVSGVMNIGGDAYDDNAIVGMEYSLDDRVSFNDIAFLKYQNNTKTKVGWSIRVDSENLVDGIQTIWIRAKDGTGSVGYSPLTVTVDHKKPIIRVDYPIEKSIVDGTFKALGYVKDNVDVKGVSFSIEGAGSDAKFKEVKLLPGTPYWSFPVNLSKYKDGKFKLTAKVEDVAGNLAFSSINVVLNTSKDKPIINLKSFKKDTRFSTSVQISGDLSDDDDAKSVSIKITKENVTTPVYSEVIDCKYYFSKEIDITDKAKYPEGRFFVELIPTDIYGISGNPVKESFVIDRENPTFDENTLNSWAGKYSSGKLNIPLKIIDYGGLQSVKYTITDPVLKSTLVNKKELKFKESKTGVFDTDKIADDLSKIVKDKKIVSLRVEAVDYLNNVSVLNVPILVDTGMPTIKDLIIDSKIGLNKDQTVDIDDNFSLGDVLIEFTSPDKKEPEKTVLNYLKIKDGFTKEYSLKVKSSDGKNYLEYSFNITAKDLSGNETKKSFKINFKETKSATHKIRINITSKGNLNFNESNMALLDDTNFGLDAIGNFIYFLADKNVENVKFKYEEKVEEIVSTKDAKGKMKEEKIIKSVLNDVSSTLLNPDIGIYLIKFTGEQRRKIKVGNNIGKLFTVSKELVETEFASFNFINDLEMPVSSIIWPPSFVNFNNNLFIYGLASDDNDLTIQYSIDSENNFNDGLFLDVGSIQTENIPNLDPLKRTENVLLSKYLEENKVLTKVGDKLFKIELPIKDMKQGEHYIVFKIRDISGKEILKKCFVYYDAINPNINLFTPKDKEIVNGEITIRGDANDDKIIANVVIMHNGKEIVADGTKMWETLYNLNNLEGVDKTQSLNSHNIEMFALDAAGNKKFFSREVKIDTTSDAPVVYVNNPSVPDQRFTGIIEIAGVALDDDGVEYVQYRIDSELAGLDENSNIGKWERIEMKKGNPNWTKKIPKELLPPGRHILDVQAVDMYGLHGKIVTIPFHLDLENPQIRILNPQNGTYLEGEKTISGRASDPNGIDYIEISTNYGWTFVKAEGQENWKYYFDSRSVPDGSLRVLIRAKDKAGSEAFSFALYNIDNKRPEVEVLMPKEKMAINNKFRIIGRAKDNIGIESVRLSINSKYWQKEQKKKIGDDMFDGYVDAYGETKEAWYYDIDTTNWMTDETETNKFQMVVIVKDMAGNVAEKMVNFEISPVSDLPVVELDQPQPGQHMTGDTLDFNGTVYDDDGVDAVYVKIDDREKVKALISGNVWSYSLPTVDISVGIHKVIIVAQEKTEDGSPGKFSGPITRLFYFDDAGPVIDITSHMNGKPMGHRPWLSGTSHYYERDLELKLKKQIQLNKFLELKKKYRRTPEKMPEMETIDVKPYEVSLLKSQYLFDNRIKDIYLSIDNGKTYEKNIGLTANWQTRVQTQYLKDGLHMLQIKAVTHSGKESIRYLRVLIDRNVPNVVIDEPIENQSLNEKILVRGSADDKNKVDMVKIALRPYDKDLGKVPKFVQGIYLWAQLFSGPWVSAGFGLSFFDDIVRLEGLYAWTATRSNLQEMGFDPNNAPEFLRQTFNNSRYQPRFSGFTTGGKLLARIIDIPWEFFWGEDFKNFSWSVEIGCGFYWFSGFGGVEAERNNTYYQQEKGRDYDPLKDGKLLAGFMYQVDLFKVERWGIFRKFAIYFENSFYFITSEVEGGLFPQFGFGIRNAFF